MISTFYSFKGGVGRSMALANVAEYFHAKGLRVAMIDWDLEAPGLEAYFYPTKIPDTKLDELLPNPALADVRQRPGLIDLLRDYKTEFPEFTKAQHAPPVSLKPAASSKVAVESERSNTGLSDEERKEKVLSQLEDFPEFLLLEAKKQLEQPQIAEAYSSEPRTLEQFLDSLFSGLSNRFDSLSAPFSSEFLKSPLRGYLQCIHGPESGRQNGLLLLTAGARAGKQFAEFARAVQDFNWAEFYGVYDGGAFFKWLRDRLKEIVDIVLIDSRTGVTEMGGICTRVMADLVVCFCAPNGQNVEGVGKIIDGLKNDSRLLELRDERQIEVIAVPTRIDDAEAKLLGRFKKDFIDDVQSKAVPERLKETEDPLWSLQIPYIPQFNYSEKRVIGPVPDVPRTLDPPSEKLVASYRKIAVSMAALAEENSPIHRQFADELATTFPHLQTPRTPDMAPALPETYVERFQDSAALQQALLQKSVTRGISRVAVWGPAGVGKTTLVARVCHDDQVRAAYPGGVVWLTCDRGWTTESVEDFLRTSFGLGRSFRGPLLAEFLAEKKFIFVADNVWDNSDFAPVFAFGKQCTQVIVSRDLNTASAFSDSVVTIGMLSDPEAAQLLKSPNAAQRLAGSEDPQSQLSGLMVQWPLTAALLRSALERRLAQRDPPEQAWQNLAQAVSLHGIVAFDQPNATERSASVSRSLTSTVGHLKPEGRALLLTAAKAKKNGGLAIETAPESLADPEDTKQRKRAARQLASFGLTTLEGGRLQVEEIVYAWLVASGQVVEASARSFSGPRVSSSEDKKTAEDVERAKRVLRGESAPLPEIIDLAERLTGMRYYSYARRLFGRARQHPDAGRLPQDKKLKLAQRYALCTYRNPDLPVTIRYAQALEALESADLHAPEPSQETLGLAGAIHKYLWNFTGQRTDLERSYFEYERGTKQPIKGDFGYTRVNAAFVADLLARQQEDEAPEISARFRNEARRFREEIVYNLPALADLHENAWLKQQWWYPATLAEAYFGLQRFEEARFWLREAVALGAPDWQMETTTRQLAMLAKTQHGEFQDDSPAWSCLRILVGDAIPAVRTITAGKVGLALSGGGFRASLFHIGVLARLAELDVLRHVEVLSCVSGGSIVGAHYYLEVRELIQRVPDSEITRDHYIEIVRRIQRDFLDGVQKNPRTRLFANWLGNLQSLFVPAYSRTKILGELFERYFYHRIPGIADGPLWLDELKISPQGWPDDFNPKLDNWRRAAKAPIILLNATALNSGHNWQFAVNWMGEPPLGASGAVDRNDVLRRMYYWEAPRRYRKIRLGDAVAASACVPALFDPLEMPGLYPDQTLRLIDGGVHDNQGIAGLIEQECRVLIVSDASGQMNSEPRPSSSILGVPLRANNILQARVREAEFRELSALSNASALTGFMFLHLKKDLAAKQVDWTDCPDPDDGSDSLRPANRNTLTSYGMPRALQARLAGIRTDLDSFSDAEAYALMFSGYRMADQDLPQSIPQFSVGLDVREQWDFLAVERAVNGDDQAHEKLMRVLRAASESSMKIWRLSPSRAMPGLFGALAIFGAVAYLIYFFRSHIGFALAFLFGIAHVPLNSWTFLAACAAVAILLWLAHRRQKSFSVIVTGLLMITVGWALALMHLALFDPQYLAYGSVPKKRG